MKATKVNSKRPHIHLQKYVTKYLIGDNYILGGLNHRELRVTSQDVKVIIATVSILLLINFFYTLFIENYNARHKTFTE